MRAYRRPPPFLRTPPFPHTRASQVAISMHWAGEATVSASRVERLLEALAEARVGGAFWGDDDPWRDPAAPVVAAGDSESIAVAAIRGNDATVTRSGRFGTPEQGPDRTAIARHILVSSQYRNPFTGEPCEVEEAIALLAGWRRSIDANRDLVVAMGMAWWKRRQIKTFLWAGRHGLPRFTASDPVGCAVAARAGGAIAVWPSRVSAALVERATHTKTAIVRVEDGFIRSVGLGSGLHPPYSVTIDRLGIHYDPERPSELEHLLETATIPADTLARAARLRAAIVAHGISKYGGDGPSPLPERTPGKRLVLVTGQVSDDLSVLHGGRGVAGNGDLLRRARACEPDSEIWFRPHPDVDAGHRNGAIPDAEALRHVDRVIRGGSMAALFETVDGLHVLTSLAGFEALLRGTDVTVHGSPFYAGWGLTRDLAPPIPRRTRRRSLDELVAATLILYPRYLDPITGLPCEVETLVSRFAEQATPRLSLLHRLRSVQGRLMRRGA